MTTAAQLRKAILECAEGAAADEPTDTAARARSFIARLSGSMEGLGEDALDKALWSLLKATDTTNPSKETP